MSRAELQRILRAYRISPDTYRGQHFLVDDTVLDAIVHAAGVTSHDTIVEIGPGVGNMTMRLERKAKKVIAVELDRNFKPLLDTLATSNKKISIIYGDILKVSFNDIRQQGGIDCDGGYKVVANIPYYLTSKLISHVVHLPLLPQSIFFLVQHEVAERIVAPAGHHSKLSLSVQFYGTPAIKLKVSRQKFYPQPRVDSALLAITELCRWQYSESEKLVWRLIAFGFSAKRKKLLNNLIAGLQKSREDVIKILDDANIPQNVRAEGLSIGQWLTLARIIQASHGA